VGRPEASPVQILIFFQELDVFSVLVSVSFVSSQVSRFHGSDFRTFTQSGNTLILVSLLASAVVAVAFYVW
jgi:hypothetical protein